MAWQRLQLLLFSRSARLSIILNGSAFINPPSRTGLNSADNDGHQSNPTLAATTMGPRPQLHASFSAQTRHLPRSTRLHNHNRPSTLPLQILQKRWPRSQTTIDRRNGHAQAQESLGAGARACQTIAHECHWHVHDGQQPTDFLDHDGVHAIQGAGAGGAEYSGYVSEAGDGGEQAADVLGEGGVCGV